MRNGGLQASPHHSERLVKRLVEVTIDGKSLTFRSDADPDYLDDLAKFFEAKYLEVSPKRGGNPYKQAVLAALNITEELFQERTRNEELKEKVKQRCARIQELIEEVDLGAVTRGGSKRRVGPTPSSQDRQERSGSMENAEADEPETAQPERAKRAARNVERP